jgi:hypothetical protein
MQQPTTQKQGLTLGATRELLLPATLLACFALYYFARQPFGVVLACALPMLLLYALAPLWAARSLTRFDRDSVRLLAAGDPAALRARYRRALGMRLFAPAAQLSERKAMVLLESGDALRARAAYRDALAELGPAASARVVLGHAHASFATGDDAGAIASYRRVLANVGALPGVERKLACALVRHGEDLRAALALLDRTGSELGQGAERQELVLWRSLAFAKLGDRARAQELMAQAVDARSPSADALRAQIQRRLDGAVAPRD